MTRLLSLMGRVILSAGLRMIAVVKIRENVLGIWETSDKDIYALKRCI